MLKQNRLIELEQELFKQKQSLKNNQKNKSKTFNYQNNTSDNNRLLQLEQELINQHKIKNEPPIKDNQEYQRMAKIVNNKSSANNKIFELQQSISKVNFSQKKSQKQNHKKSRNQKVQAMTFDYNEAIQLQYQDNSFAASLHYTKTELSNNNHNSTAFDLDNDISTIEVESFEVKEADDTNTQSVIPEVLPPTPQQETESQQIADVEAFEADIQAILDGTKLYDKPKQQNTNNTPSLSETKSNPQTQNQNQSPPPQPQKQNPHAIFDKIAQNMAYANSFDLGTISLEQTFDEFDSLLDAQESKALTVKSSPTTKENQLVELNPLLSL